MYSFPLQEAPDNCIVVLCANKTDVDEKNWKVSRSEFMAFANTLNYPCYEASAATAFNVEHVSINSYH